MAKEVTLDSSVLVSAFVKEDNTCMQVAKEKEAALATFDGALAEKAKVAVEVLTLKDFEK